MNTVGLIPARGGSKGVPKKNIRGLNGKPLIAYTIEAALGASLLSRVIVSTDSLEIAAISKQYGAEVPYLRPREIARDDTPDKPVCMHLIRWLKDNENFTFNYLVLLRPTTPFKTPQLIDFCIEKLHQNQNLTSIRTVTKAEGVHHPYWMFRAVDETLEPFVKEVDGAKYYQRQLLPPCYRVNGVVDVIATSSLAASLSPYGDNIGFVEIDEKVAIDIDTSLDFEFCTFLMESEQRHMERFQNQNQWLR